METKNIAGCKKKAMLPAVVKLYSVTLTRACGAK
jgi:hypothetical protein